MGDPSLLSLNVILPGTAANLKDAVAPDEDVCHKCPHCPTIVKDKQSAAREGRSVFTSDDKGRIYRQLYCRNDHYRIPKDSRGKFVETLP